MPLYYIICFALELVVGDTVTKMIDLLLCYYNINTVPSLSFRPAPIATNDEAKL